MKQAALKLKIFTYALFAIKSDCALIGTNHLTDESLGSIASKRDTRTIRRRRIRIGYCTEYPNSCLRAKNSKSAENDSKKLSVSSFHNSESQLSGSSPPTGMSTWTQFGSFSSSSTYHRSASSPIPTMPSQLFQQLASSQLDILASSLMVASRSGSKKIASKVKSMALYLPQENGKTGQLEFVPSVLYPHPDTDRIFIASDSDSGVAPTLPKLLTKLPGFADARALIPGYPMVASGSNVPGVGVVEEVAGSDRSGNGTALSIPLFSGSKTVGLLFVSPIDELFSDENKSIWTENDRQQVARAAQSLSLALSMETERLALERQNTIVKEALSDSLHQIKNPLQALRTYIKLLQLGIAETSESSDDHPTRSPRLLKLADHLMIQSDRLSDRLKPVDLIIESLGDPSSRPTFLLLSPGKESSLVQYKPPPNATESESAFLSQSQPLSILSHQTLASSAMSSDSESFDYETTTKSVNTERNGLDSLLLFDAAQGMSINFLDDLLDSTFSTFHAIASERRLDFAIEMAEDLPGVFVSPNGVQEVVSNLLDNAFKYVSLFDNPRPRVRVRVRSNKLPLEPGVTILVEDNGGGIPDHERSIVFERGYRGSAASASSVVGSGLGLDIARSVVQRMGGFIRVLTRTEAQKMRCLSGAVIEVVLYRQPFHPS